MLQAMEIVKHIGIGPGEALRGVDLSPPGETMFAAAKHKDRNSLNVLRSSKLDAATVSQYTDDTD